MENLKIVVTNKKDANEAINLFMKLGFKRPEWSKKNREIESGIVAVCQDDMHLLLSDEDENSGEYKEITLDQLRQMVNPMKEYSEIKEYLDPNDNYSYHKVPVIAQGSGWIEIPEWANFYSEGGFFKDKSNWWSSHHEKWVNHDDRNLKFIIGEILWTRPTKPEELPFIDDEPINPQHYKNGKVECIDALESATVNKTGIEAVCVANIIKYLWRYEDKNGIEDVQKAKWYLDKLLEKLNEN